MVDPSPIPDQAQSLLLGKHSTDSSYEALLLSLATRHGLITGTTGSGKTVTLQRLAEECSRLGIPVIAPDIKGDLSGIGEPSAGTGKIVDRFATLGVPFKPMASPVQFWDVRAKSGMALKATLLDLGPVLTAHILSLNTVQESCLSILFTFAQYIGYPLRTLEELSHLLLFAQANLRPLSAKYGNLSTASLSAIQRQVSVSIDQGFTDFIGDESTDPLNFITTDRNGRGVVHLIAADQLFSQPKLYTVVLVWLLERLYALLPEVGEVERPKLVMFFDEAHLFFEDSTRSFIVLIERILRLIRSKGVGMYFVSQSPTDLSETVLSQLGHRVAHALRAYTEKEQKALRSAAQSFRANAAFDTAKVLEQLAVGEALVSLLDDHGAPSVVQRTLILPPVSKIGAIDPGLRLNIVMQRMRVERKTVPIPSMKLDTMQFNAHGELVPLSDADEEVHSDGQSSLLKQFGMRAANSIGTQVVRSVVPKVIKSRLGAKLGSTLLSQLVRSLTRKR